MWQSPVYNSIPVYNLRLINYLARHPLLNNQLVKDPITNEPIDIIAYRQKGGLSGQPGLICSVYPAYQSFDTVPPSPTATGVSALYKDFVIGNNQLEVMYHFIVEFSYFYEISFDDNTSIEEAGLEYLAQVPLEGLVFPDQFPASQQQKTVQIFIDPPQFIVGTYQELAVLAFNDDNYRAHLKIPELRGISVVHANLPTSSRWEKGLNLIVSTSTLYLRLHCYINKDWTKTLDPTLRQVGIEFDGVSDENISVTLEEPE